MEAIRLPSSIPAFSAGLPERTSPTNTPSVSRLDAALDVEMPMTARGDPASRISIGGAPGMTRTRGFCAGADGAKAPVAATAASIAANRI
jgi:hypothetical protein